MDKLPLLLFLFLIAASSADTWITKQITNDSSNQVYPSLWDNYISWDDDRNGGMGGTYDIYMYDIWAQNETQVTSEIHNQRGSAIYGDLIAYWDNNGNKIHLYNITSRLDKEIRVTGTEYAYPTPAIWGNYVVWPDTSMGGSSHIFLYNIANNTETSIAGTGMQSNPAIYSNLVVYEDFRSGNFHINLYNISSGLTTQLTNYSSNQKNPDIYGDSVVYDDDRLPQKSILLYNLTSNTETRITPDSAIAEKPSIYGDNVAWQDNRNGNWDVYSYSISGKAETQLTTSPLFQGDPKVNKRSIVWDEYAGTDWNVFFARKSICADTNDDGIITLSDPVYLSGILNGANPLPIMWPNADMDNSGDLTIGDYIRELDFIYGGRYIACVTPPPSPYQAGYQLVQGSEYNNGSANLIPFYIKVSNTGASEAMDFILDYDSTIEPVAVNSTNRTAGATLTMARQKTPRKIRISIQNYSSPGNFRTFAVGSGDVAIVTFARTGPAANAPMISQASIFDANTVRMGDTSYMPIPTVISLSATSIYRTSATISWSADTYSNVTLRFGLSPNNYPNSSARNDSAIAGYVVLSPLQPNTTYFYRLTACNAFGCNNSIERNLTTPLTSPAQITNVSCTEIAFTSMKINWLTDANSNSTVNYGNSPSNKSQQASIPDNVTSHSVLLQNLPVGAYAYFNISSCSDGCVTSSGYQCSTNAYAYGYAISPISDSFGASNSSNAITNRIYSLSYAGNQNVSFICNANASWVSFINCPSALIVGNPYSIVVRYNTSNFAAKIYGVLLSFISNANVSIPVTLNVSANPYNPAPWIIGVNANPSYDSAIINWLTPGINSNSTINYGGNSSNLDRNVTSNETIDNHTFVISGLQPSTKYFYVISSCSIGGCNVTGTNSFNTTAIPSGCAYNNPPCSQGQNCVNNQCQSPGTGPSGPSGPSGPGSSSSSSTGGNPGNGNTGSKKPSPSPSPSVPPESHSQYVKIRDEIESQLPDLADEESIDIKDLLSQAETLRKQGKIEQAKVILSNAQKKLNDSLNNSKIKKANFTWPLVIGVILIIAVLAFYFVRNTQKKDAALTDIKSEISPEPEIKPELTTIDALDQANDESVNDADLLAELKKQENDDGILGRLKPPKDAV